MDPIVAVDRYDSHIFDYGCMLRHFGGAPVVRYPRALQHCISRLPRNRGKRTPARRGGRAPELREQLIALIADWEKVEDVAFLPRLLARFPASAEWLFEPVN